MYIALIYYRVLGRCSGAHNGLFISLLMHVQANVLIVSPLARVVKGNKMVNLAAVKTPFNLFTPQVSVPCCIVFYSVRCDIKQTDRQTDLCACVPRFDKNYMKYYLCFVTFSAPLLL